MLCKLAELYCIFTDYLLGRDEQKEMIPRTDDIIPIQTLRTLIGKPEWNASRGWSLVNSEQDYVIFMDSTKVILAEAMNMRTMAQAFSIDNSPTTKPIPLDDVRKHESL